MKKKLEDLHQVTTLFLEKDLETHRRNLANSARLLSELAQIDNLREAAQADQGSIGARQILGADALWQGWLVRKRAEVLRHTAMARAQEADSLARARIAFSRAEAAETLVQQEAFICRTKRLKAEADAIDSLGVLKTARTQGVFETEGQSADNVKWFALNNSQPTDFLR